MDFKRLTSTETKEITDRQIFTLETGLAKGIYSLDDIGDLVPGAIMVHDMSALTVTYMNNWGCEALGHSMDEINGMGEEYYRKFFLPEESKWFIPGMMDFYKREDQSSLYSFFHQVRTGPKLKFSWHYAVCKFLRTNLDHAESTRLILVANPIAGMGLLVNRVHKLLDENLFVAKNYKKFALLTKREKEIITHLGAGKSSSEISDMLFISKHTVNTHRKHILKKLDVNTFAELIRFANAFELI